MTKQYIGSYTLQDFNDTTFSAEYSLTGLDGSWHTSFQSGDLFMRTKTGESSWSQAIRIVGEDGATGQSIVSVTPQYYLSTSSTSRVGGSWSNEMPAWVSGNYLWTREEVRWENPTDITFTTEILAKALNSANETAATAQTTAAAAQTTATAAQTTANGKNTVYYQESEPTGGTYKANDVWFDTNNGNKMYRWSGTAWIAALFEVGAIGSTIIENGFITTPLLNASNIQTGTLDASVVTVSNLDAGKITTGELDASQVNITNLNAANIYVGESTTSVQDKINEFDAFEVGGRNLIPNTKDLTGYTYRTSDTYLGFNIARTTRGATGYLDTFSARTIDIPTGSTYVASFYARASVTTPMNCHWYSPNTTTSSLTSTGNRTTAVDGTATIQVTTEWKKYWVVWTQTLTELPKSLIIGRNATIEGAILEIAGVKLEMGNKPTDWTPAPEDVSVDIATRTAEVQEAARVAAEDYANAQKALTDATAKAYADGILTTAENKAIAEAAAALSEANQNLNTATTNLQNFVLQHVSDETAEIKSYIRSNASGNLEIGSLSGVSKLIQSPTAMTFMVGTIPVATFGSGETDIPKAGVDTELRIGDKTSNYYWVSDTDGGMSLIWK